MAPPSKGTRTRIVTRVPDPVRIELERQQREAGVSSFSQFLADLLAVHTGHPALVAELDQKALKISA